MWEKSFCRILPMACHNPAADPADYSLRPWQQCRLLMFANYPRRLTTKSWTLTRTPPESRLTAVLLCTSCRASRDGRRDGRPQWAAEQPDPPPKCPADRVYNVYMCTRESATQSPDAVE